MSTAYDSGMCSENEAAVSTPDEDSCRIFENSNPRSSWVTIKWGLDMEQPFSLCSTRALNAGAEFPSTSMYVIILGFVLYNILSTKIDMLAHREGQSGE